jgi:protein SCO1/2
MFVMGKTSTSFVGTEMTPPRDVMDFELTNQFGTSIHLTDLSPKLVVLTFLYTHCPDICPLTTSKLHQTYSLLGDKASLIQFLVITVDPERDSQIKVEEYSDRYGMTDKWYFLIGNKDELDPIWKYYWVGNSQLSAVQNLLESSAEYATDDTKPNSEAASPVLSHSAPIHIIQGDVIRLVYGESFQPTELAHDLEMLLRE